MKLAAYLLATTLDAATSIAKLVISLSHTHSERFGLTHMALAIESKLRQQQYEYKDDEGEGSNK